MREEIPENGSVRVYVHTAIDGYAWQGVPPALAQSLQACLDAAGTFPGASSGRARQAAGGAIRCSLSGVRGTAVYRYHRRIAGDFRGRDSHYVALAFFPADFRFDLRKVWSAPAMRAPVDGAFESLALSPGDWRSGPDLSSAGVSPEKPVLESVVVPVSGPDAPERIADAFQGEKYGAGALNCPIFVSSGGAMDGELVYEVFPEIPAAAAAKEDFFKIPGHSMVARREKFEAWESAVSALEAKAARLSSFPVLKRLALDARASIGAAARIVSFPSARPHQDAAPERRPNAGTVERRADAPRPRAVEIGPVAPEPPPNRRRRHHSVFPFVFSVAAAAAFGAGFAMFLLRHAESAEGKSHAESAEGKSHAESAEEKSHAESAESAEAGGDSGEAPPPPVETHAENAEGAEFSGSWSAGSDAAAPSAPRQDPAEAGTDLKPRGNPAGINGLGGGAKTQIKEPEQGETANSQSEESGMEEGGNETGSQTAGKQSGGQDSDPVQTTIAEGAKVSWSGSEGSAAAAPSPAPGNPSPDNPALEKEPVAPFDSTNGQSKLNEKQILADIEIIEDDAKSLRDSVKRSRVINEGDLPRLFSGLDASEKSMRLAKAERDLEKAEMELKITEGLVKQINAAIEDLNHRNGDEAGQKAEGPALSARSGTKPQSRAEGTESAEAGGGSGEEQPPPVESHAENAEFSGSANEGFVAAAPSAASEPTSPDNSASTKDAVALPDSAKLQTGPKPQSGNPALSATTQPPATTPTAPQSTTTILAVPHLVPPKHISKQDIQDLRGDAVDMINALKRLAPPEFDKMTMKEANDKFVDLGKDGVDADYSESWLFYSNVTNKCLPIKEKLDKVRKFKDDMRERDADDARAGAVYRKAVEQLERVEAFVAGKGSGDRGQALKNLDFACKNFTTAQELIDRKAEEKRAAEEREQKAKEKLRRDKEEQRKAQRKLEERRKALEEEYDDLVESVYVRCREAGLSRSESKKIRDDFAGYGQFKNAKYWLVHAKNGFGRDESGRVFTAEECLEFATRCLRGVGGAKEEVLLHLNDAISAAKAAASTNESSKNGD